MNTELEVQLLGEIKWKMKASFSFTSNPILQKKNLFSIFHLNYSSVTSTTLNNMFRFPFFNDSYIITKEHPVFSSL